MSAIFGFFALISMVLFVLHILICIWAYRDALDKSRRQDVALIVLLAMLFFPVIGLIIYLVIRNDLGR